MVFSLYIPCLREDGEMRMRTAVRTLSQVSVSCTNNHRGILGGSGHVEECTGCIARFSMCFRSYVVRLWNEKCYRYRNEGRYW